VEECFIHVLHVITDLRPDVAVPSIGAVPVGSREPVLLLVSTS